MEMDDSQKISYQVGIARLRKAEDDDKGKVSEVGRNLLACNTCWKQPTLIGVFDDRFLIVRCECNNLSKEWAVCMECISQKTRITSFKQLKQHVKNVHGKKRKRSTDEGETLPCPTGDILEIATQDNLEESFADSICDDEIVMSEDIITQESHYEAMLEDVRDSEKLGFRGDNNQTFFQQYHLSRGCNGGTEYLVKNSYIEATLTAEDICNLPMPSHHTRLQMEIAQLSFLLTKNQNAMLASVLGQCYEIGCEDGYSQAICDVKTEDSLVYKPGKVVKGAHVHSTHIPKSWNDLRRHHLQGKRSIVKNLPIPKVQEDIKNHSYVSLIDCIRDFLGHNSLSDIALVDDTTVDAIPDCVKHLSESLRAREIANLKQRDCLISYLTIWSDDVEPNRTKSNRGSIWLLTVTIATKLENSHSMAHTYPLAIAKKNEDHQPVIHKVIEEMEQLRRGHIPFYIGSEKRQANILFEIFANIQDQPERRDFNCMRAGNGLHSSRFGISANHSAIYKNGKLAACGPCLKTMEERMKNRQCDIPLPHCTSCLNWDALTKHEPSLGQYKPPKGYPLVQNSEADEHDTWYKNHSGCRLTNKLDEPEQQLLCPFKITYDGLKNAVDFIHDAFCHHEWSHQQCSSYLQVEGLDDKIIEKVLEHASRCYSLLIAQSDQEKYRAIINDARQNPSKYQKLAYPAPWIRPGMTLNLHPDVIMHLLFLGVVKTVLGQIQSWHVAQMKWSSFIRSTKSYLDAFKTMTIDWIAVLQYNGGKLGGWVSENYLGFSRIMLWFFQNMSEADPTLDNDAPPEGLPQSKWSHKQNKYWLRVRHLDTSGKKSVVAKRVADYLSQTSPPEPAAMAPFEVESVQDTLLALAEVLRCVMKPYVTSELVNRTRYAVRIFLSKYDAMCKPLVVKTTRVPPVLSSYNFICLLNLPSAMEKFGPLRGLWEGGPMGEKFAGFAKPFMKQGIRQQNWHRNLHRRLLRAKAFASIRSVPEPPLSDVTSEKALGDRSRHFHKYKSEFDFVDLFNRVRINRKQPISVVLLLKEDGTVAIYGVVGDYDTIMQVSLIENEATTHALGLTYFTFMSKQLRESVPWADVSTSVRRIGYGLLLPLLQPGRSQFALISSNWEVLSASNELQNLID